MTNLFLFNVEFESGLDNNSLCTYSNISVEAKTKEDAKQITMRSEDLHHSQIFSIGKLGKIKVYEVWGRNRSDSKNHKMEFVKAISKKEAKKNSSFEYFKPNGIYVREEIDPRKIEICQYNYIGAKIDD